MEDEVRVARHRPAQVRRARPDALTATKRQRFLDMLAATSNVERAASHAGATPTAFYLLRRRDAGFATAWSETLADGYVALESRLLATARGTVEQPVGDADRVDAAVPFDPRLALDLMRQHDARARAPKTTRKAAYRYMPIDEVERSLIAKLEALERRLAASGALPAPTPAVAIDHRPDPTA